MNRDIIRRAKDVAVQAAQKAGQVAREHFDKTAVIREKGDFGDVVTEADYRAEEIIPGEIAREFPDHRIISEESGGNDKDCHPGSKAFFMRIVSEGLGRTVEDNQ